MSYLSKYLISFTILISSFFAGDFFNLVKVFNAISVLSFALCIYYFFMEARSRVINIRKGNKNT